MLRMGLTKARIIRRPCGAPLVNGRRLRKLPGKIRRVCGNCLRDVRSHC